MVVGPVKSLVTPFTLGVYTDSTEPAATEKLNRGFMLKFRQRPCA